ncbi:MAG: HAD-IB family phosphatase [Alphaproteobacteria bacterium]|nr:HAD-IB family phosphatase [Alphaproteobacteria bacterium]
MPKSVAIFDFDHTLITGDSFMPYLAFVAGTAATAAALAKAAAALAAARARGHKPETRTFLKSRLIRTLLGGKKIADLADAATRAAAWQTANKPVLDALRDHRAHGDTIVIASGGLDLYLPAMLRAAALDVPYDALICTDIGVENGVVTGEMVNGNCVRAVKAERVKAWLDAHGPFDTGWAYGNYPHDVPMMQLVRHRIIVS